MSLEDILGNVTSATAMEAKAAMAATADTAAKATSKEEVTWKKELMSLCCEEEKERKESKKDEVTPGVKIAENREEVTPGSSLKEKHAERIRRARDDAGEPERKTLDDPDGDDDEVEVPRCEELMRKMRVLTRQLPAWSGIDFCEIRQDVFAEKHHTLIPALTTCLLESTEKALREQRYVTDMEVVVNLKGCRQAFPGVKWIGQVNATPIDCYYSSRNSVSPPIVCVDHLPLTIVEMVSTLDASAGRQFIVTLEATDFDTKGNLRKRSRKESQLATFVCTDLADFVDQAAAQLKGGETTVEKHLAAEHDPYVFLCMGATLFRGGSDDGYPFLEKPVSMDVVVSAPCCERPGVKVQMDDRSQWYVEERHHVALLERLNLIGMAAYDPIAVGQFREEKRRDILKGFDDEEEAATPPADRPLPILILSAFGLLDGGKHPIDAIGVALKFWRQRYSGQFHSIFLACGDTKLALRLDRIVNSDVYEAHRARQETQTRAEQGLKPIPGGPTETDLRYPMCRWHWNAEIQDLSITRLLPLIGRSERNLMYGDFEAARKSSKLAAEQEHRSSRRNSRRKSSGAIDLHQAFREGIQQARRPSAAALGELKDAIYGDGGLRNTQTAAAGALHETSPRTPRRQSFSRQGDAPGRPRRMSTAVPEQIAERWKEEKSAYEAKRMEVKAALAAGRKKPTENEESEIASPTTARMQARKLKGLKDTVEKTEEDSQKNPDEILAEAQRLAESLQDKVASKSEWDKLFHSEQKFFNNRGLPKNRAEEIAQNEAGRRKARRKRGAGIFIRTEASGLGPRFERAGMGAK